MEPFCFVFCVIDYLISFHFRQRPHYSSYAAEISRKRKRSFLKTLSKLEEFNNAGFTSSCMKAKNSLNTEILENDDVMIMIVAAF